MCDYAEEEIDALETVFPATPRIILENLAEIRENQKEMKEMLGQILSSKSDPKDIIIEDIKQSPAKSEKELLEIIRQLENPEFKEKLSAVTDHEKCKFYGIAAEITAKTRTPDEIQQSEAGGSTYHHCSNGLKEGDSYGMERQSQVWTGPYSSFKERTWRVSDRDVACPMPECPVITRHLRQQALADHLSPMFESNFGWEVMQNQGFHRFRGHMVILLARWLTGRQYVTSAEFFTLLY
ncbi:unnamed protein product [Mytilus coruscus]|uniref:Uncharacterized protein n=1 Tax=Mytilus coruscus TaxID=42192 RepID=A0A6J8EJ72_MYTCO|nr:unnamed protein product [Mytilus coruscus]